MCHCRTSACELCSPPCKSQADALLELVKGRGSKSFYAFCDALGESTIEHQRSLADLLTAQAEECK